ncbi:MAG: hypothetical protein ABSA97_02590 [Verrucomicrobiia bacterium]
MVRAEEEADADVSLLGSSPIYFLMFATNTESLSWPGISLATERKGVTFIQTYKYQSEDVRAIPAMLFKAFTDIDMYTQFLGTTNLVKPGEWAIFVSPKQF